METKWPETVPVLEAGDFCRDSFSRGQRNCLLGWLEVALPYECEDRAGSAICRAARELVAASTDKQPIYLSEVNDNRKNSRDLLARIWNRAMAKLGYVVNNPEAKYLKRK